MDVIEEIKKDKAYLKCKLIVKNWEKDFKVRYSRTPSKLDIKEAPSKIKYAYKKYFQLKSGALENSLSICDIVEDMPVGSPEFIQPLEDTDTSNSQESFLPALPTACELNLLLSASEKSTKVTSVTPENPFTENLSKKLFKNRRFSLRNPRKVLSTKDKCLQSNGSFSASDSIASECNKSITSSNSSTTLSLTLSENNNFSFSINKIRNEIVLNQNNTVSSKENRDHIKNVPVRQINVDWLERATGIECENVNSCGVESEKFGIRNLKPVIVEPSHDIVENSDSEDDIVISKLTPALKKRKTDTINQTDLNNKQTEDNNTKTDNVIFPGMKTQLVKKKTKTKNEKVSKANIIKNEVVETEPPDIREFLPFGLQEKYIPRHTNISDVLSTADISNINAKSSQGHKNKESNLLNKIQSGTLNENFVKINIEKKVFVRGKKSFNYSKYKKSMWKDKKSLHGGMEFPESGKVTCFKCGLPGHMARYCTAHKENSLIPLENYQENDLPTLDEMKDIVNQETTTPCSEEVMNTILYKASQVPVEVLKLLTEVPTAVNEVPPVFNNCEQNAEELFAALKKFGHTSFRPGQEQAIKRILCGKSTLLILSTGSGKSLCYQLPAYIYSQHYRCVTLVISPLVSLMEDQVFNMPDFLKAGCLHTNQQPTQRRKIIELLKNGDINILLISPEALIAGDTSNGFTGLFKSLPPIAFACIDEAHCVSQWSHNFRPSYLMICRVLRERLNVKSILGLTATASQTTIKSIIDHINVPDGLNGVLTNPALPNNLYLSMSFEKDKDRALVSLLNTETISSFNSIIVYCIRRNECERVAAVIRSCLSQPGKQNFERGNLKRKRMSYIAEAYHAGMSAAQRKKIQKHFMDGTLKIIVATVAFGMGINKSDIRCIIHYNMPSSFESYVQEVGRAGRDGHPAFCHVFISNSSSDKDELLKHIYANSIDRSVIRKLLQKVFISCKCSTNNSIHSGSISIFNRCTGHEVGIPIDSLVEELDLPSENIATLLCYIELHDKHYIKVLNNAYITCKISSYGGPAKLLEAAKTCPPLAMAYVLESKNNPEHMKCSVLEFNVIEVAAAIGWESGMTKYRLKNLEWVTVGASSQRSQLKVEFNTLGFKIKAPGDLTPNELDTMLDDLHKNVQIQEKVMLHQLEEIHTSFSQLCTSSCELINFTESSLEHKSNELKLIINNYFMRDNNVSDNIVIPERPLDVDQISTDVRALIVTYKDCNFTGRSIARIFQGISSPNYPALVWGRCRFWRLHLKEDFYGIVKIATQEIIKMKCNL